MEKKLTAIWAEDTEGLIGVDGHLPWRLPAELAHFKRATLHQAILMGRKTYDGMQRRVLPDRDSLVLSRQELADTGAVEVLHSRAEALAWYAAQDKDLFVIGGAELYRLFAGDFDRLLQTVVEGQFAGDTYFPEDFPWEGYQVAETAHHPADERNPYAFEVRTWERV